MIQRKEQAMKAIPTDILVQLCRLCENGGDMQPLLRAFLENPFAARALEGKWWTGHARLATIPSTVFDFSQLSIVDEKVFYTDVLTTRVVRQVFYGDKKLVLPHSLPDVMMAMPMDNDKVLLVRYLENQTVLGYFDSGFFLPQSRNPELSTIFCITIGKDNHPIIAGKCKGGGCIIKDVSLENSADPILLPHAASVHSLAYNSGNGEMTWVEVNDSGNMRMVTPQALRHDRMGWGKRILPNPHVTAGGLCYTVNERDGLVFMNQNLVESESCGWEFADEKPISWFEDSGHRVHVTGTKKHQRVWVDGMPSPKWDQVISAKVNKDADALIVYVLDGRNVCKKTYRF